MKPLVFYIFIDICDNSGSVDLQNSRKNHAQQIYDSTVTLISYNRTIFTLICSEKAVSILSLVFNLAVMLSLYSLTLNISFHGFWRKKLSMYKFVESLYETFGFLYFHWHLWQFWFGWSTKFTNKSCPI